MFLNILSIILIIFTVACTIEMTILTLSNIFIKRKKTVANRKKISLAVIIPAHNEELNIKRCIESIKKCRKTYNYEIFVIADNCNDETAKVAEAAGAKVLERFSDTEKGKGFALKHAFDYLEDKNYFSYIIVDADTVVEANFIEVVGDKFSMGASAVQTTYLVNDPEQSKKTKLMNLALMSMNAFRPLGREKLGLSVGILGNGFALSKDLLKEIPYNANSIAEDLEFHIEIVRKGRKVEFTDNTKVLADFPTSDEGNESQRARWEGGRFFLQRKFSLKLLKDIMKGKIGLIEPFLELMTLPLAFQVLLLLVLMVIGNIGVKIYGLYSVAIIFIHIICSVLFFGKVSDLVILFKVPMYILWKIIKLPLILKQSKKDAQWVRTKREEVL